MFRDPCRALLFFSFWNFGIRGIIEEKIACTIHVGPTLSLPLNTSHPPPPFLGIASFDIPIGMSRMNSTVTFGRSKPLDLGKTAQIKSYSICYNIFRTVYGSISTSHFRSDGPYVMLWYCSSVILLCNGRGYVSPVLTLTPLSHSLHRIRSEATAQP